MIQPLASLQEEALRFDGMLGGIVDRWHWLGCFQSRLDTGAMQGAMDRAFVGDFQETLPLAVVQRSGKSDLTNKTV